MTISKSPEAYIDCFETLEAAMSDPVGIRIAFRNENAATFYRMRCHNARAIRRNQNAQTYERGHPMHAACEYDRLTLLVRFEQGQCYLYFIKVEQPPPYERLSDMAIVPDTLTIQAQPGATRRIEDHSMNQIVDNVIDNKVVRRRI